MLAGTTTTITKDAQVIALNCGLPLPAILNVLALSLSLQRLKESLSVAIAVYIEVWRVRTYCSTLSAELETGSMLLGLDPADRYHVAWLAKTL